MDYFVRVGLYGQYVATEERAVSLAARESSRRGLPAEVVLDGVVIATVRDGITRRVEESTAMGRAREVGAEHGTAAGEAWLKHERNAPGLKLADGQILAHLNAGRAQAWADWPVPDLSGDNAALHDLWRTGAVIHPNAVEDAYSTAFTAAVEATVRDACETDRDFVSGRVLSGQPDDIAAE